MKAKQVCPKCECRRLVVVERVARSHTEYANGIVEQNVTSLEVSAAELEGVDGNHFRAEIGKVEAWICARCSYMELYAVHAVDALEAYARKFPGGGVRIVDREQGAYR